MTHKVTENEEEIIEFLHVLNEIHGFYFDTISAYRRLYKSFEKTQKGLSVKLDVPIDNLDQAQLIYGKGHPNLKNYQHFSTQGEFKVRIKNGGLNEVLAANLCVVLIYSYWDYYRKKRIKKNRSINSETMADVNKLRNIILKNKGVGDSSLRRCKHITWFKEGEPIIITSEQFGSIIELIRKNLWKELNISINHL